MPRNWLKVGILAQVSGGGMGFWLLLRNLAVAGQGVRYGVSEFAHRAVWPIGGALILGGVLFFWRGRGKKPPVFLVGVHVTVALAGILLLGAYLSLQD